MPQFVPFGRLFFAISLGAFGILQFIFHDFVPGRAPAWPATIAGRMVWAYVSGAALIAACAAIVFRKMAAAQPRSESATVAKRAYANAGYSE